MIGKRLFWNIEGVQFPDNDIIYAVTSYSYDVLTYNYSMQFFVTVYPRGSTSYEIK